MLMEEGLENVFARHRRMATAVRKAVAAWGLKLVASDPKWYSDTVSAIYVPEGFDGNEMARHAYKFYNPSLVHQPGQDCRQGIPHRPPGGHE